jgi:hypothetical protein
MKKILLSFVLAVVASGTFPHSEYEGLLVLSFQREVDRRLNPPPEEQVRYAQLLDSALQRTGITDLSSQYVVMVDRNQHVQALFIYRHDTRTTPGQWQFVGASPVSTGKPGRYDHFITPLGVFAHSLDNMDFRAEGTRNTLGIRGYGEKGLRIFDFGWIQAERGWGAGGQSQMRLQMHATDPVYLEGRLGERDSKGCIRIPATLNVFIDRYGLIDADYERAREEGRRLWILRPDRVPVRVAGRYLIVIDSDSGVRPQWSPAPDIGTARRQAM